MKVLRYQIEKLGAFVDIEVPVDAKYVSCTYQNDRDAFNVYFMDRMISSGTETKSFIVIPTGMDIPRHLGHIQPLGSVMTDGFHTFHILENQYWL